MAHFVYCLDSLSMADLASVGAKAAMLATLRAAGFPIPPGLCITTAAFAHALAPCRDAIDAAADVANVDDQAAATRMASALSTVSVPAALVAELTPALALLGSADTPLVIRSSATDEDGQEHSAAGQYATTLGVYGIEGVLEGILTCWRSYFSPHALAARATHPSSAQLAVLIQPLVAADCAGVCFSVDPVAQRSERLVLNSVWGLGVGAVDGTVPGDTVVLARRDLAVLERHIVDKPLQFALSRSGEAVVCNPVAEERRRAACLPVAWAKRVGEFALAAEACLGNPQDVEWAIADGQVWLLQSRPLTALAPALRTSIAFPVTWSDPAEQRMAWRPEWSGEADLPLPLEHAVSAAFAAADAEVAMYGGYATHPVRRVFNGRSYWSEHATSLHAGDQRVRQEALRALVSRLHAAGQTLWDYWGPEVVAITDRLAAVDLRTADGPTLARHLEDALGAHRRHWFIHWLMANNQIDIEQLLVATLSTVTGCEAAAASAYVPQLLMGGEHQLTRLVDRVYELAVLARTHQRVAALLASGPPDLLPRLAALPEAVAFGEQLDQLLRDYGDRSGSGYGSAVTLRSPTWREQPGQLVQLLRTYLDPRVESPMQLRAVAQQTAAAVLEQLCTECPTPAAAKLQRVVAYARRAAIALEDHNHYIDQLSTGQIRASAAAAGAWLAARGVLEDGGDVYWLELDEIVGALRADQSVSLAATIAARRAQYERWEQLMPPAILGVPSPVLDSRPPLEDEVTATATDDDGVRLQGRGASPGRTVGRARVVSDTSIRWPTVAPGDVLVAANAGPAWTPLFPVLGGLVLEQGVVTQHAATTAREYGVPAVVGVADATRRIPDGAWVHVDGVIGVVVLGETTGFD
jgi:rifampicin phosphotransferase